jgi:hypothetical protein
MALLLKSWHCCSSHGIAAQVMALLLKSWHCCSSRSGRDARADVVEHATVAVRLQHVCRGGDRRRWSAQPSRTRRSRNIRVPSGEDNSVAYLAGYSGQHRELNGS